MPRKAEANTNTECVKVVVRCRPLNPKELDLKHELAVKTDKGLGQIILNSKESGQPPKVFTFDSVYGQDCTQLEIYQDCGHGIVSSVMEGYNGTVFAYGQTGSGKTHTMEGDPSSPEGRGIIPNAFYDIFSFISHHSHCQFLVRAAFLEIYQEQVYDLLAKRKPREVREDPDHGVYVKDLTWIGIKNEAEIEKVMEVGKKNRRVGATDMNQNSSRSHSIFCITVESSEMVEADRQLIKVGKLNLVDLAGSERQSKTHAEGARLKEGIAINLSLSALGNVIKALVDPKKHTHIPYRDSKLTRLLQDSLGGNTKTVMVANIGPSMYNLEETVSTLRYATRAKSIQNKPRINEDPKDAMLRQFQEEIERLRTLLAAKDGDLPASIAGEISERIVTKTVIDQDAINAAARMAAEQAARHAQQMTEEQIRQLEAERERERNAILAEKGDVEAALKKTNEQLSTQQELLDLERRQREELNAKLAALEQQVVEGGQSVFEKAAQQERMLDLAQEEMERHRAEQAHLREVLDSREAFLEEQQLKFSSLQDEVEYKNKKLKRAFTLIQEKKGEIEDMQAEFDQERDDMLDTIRQLAKQLKYQKAVIESLVPLADVQAMEECLEWDEDLDDWVLVRPVACPSDQQRKLKDLIIDNFVPPAEVEKIKKRAEWDGTHRCWVLPHVELTGNQIRHARPGSAVGARRPVSAFARSLAESGHVNPRFRGENIIDVPLDLPDRHTQDYDEYLDASALQDALHADANQAGWSDNEYQYGYNEPPQQHFTQQSRSARPPSRRIRPSSSAGRRPPSSSGQRPQEAQAVSVAAAAAAANVPPEASFPKARGLVRPQSGRR